MLLTMGERERESKGESERVSSISINKDSVFWEQKHCENWQQKSFTQQRGVRQVCSLSPTLFNIYINELVVQLEQSTAPGLILQENEIKFLLYADDLVWLSPTAQELQQHPDQQEN